MHRLRYLHTLPYVNQLPLIQKQWSYYKQIFTQLIFFTDQSGKQLRDEGIILSFFWPVRTVLMYVNGNITSPVKGELVHLISYTSLQVFPCPWTDSDLTCSPMSCF